MPPALHGQPDGLGLPVPFVFFASALVLGFLLVFFQIPPVLSFGPYVDGTTVQAEAQRVGDALSAR